MGQRRRLQGIPAEPGRFHLFVSLACPWAHRAIIVRLLKGLQEVIGMSITDPIRDEAGWALWRGPSVSRPLSRVSSHLSSYP